MFTYGFHVQDFFNHIFFKECQTDYRELLVHHIATTSLYPGYLMGNLMAIGTLIAFLHDIADVFVVTSRFLNCIGWDKTTAVVYIGLITSWCYTRVIILPFFLYTILNTMRLPENEAFFPWLCCECTFLSILQVLNIYWFFMLVGIGVKLVTKGKIVDTVNKIEDDSKGNKDSKKSQ